MFLGGCSDESTEEPPPPDATGVLTPTWSVALDHPPFLAAPPNEGPAIVTDGDVVVAVLTTSVVVHDASTGEPTGEVPLAGPVCASASAISDGVLALLTGEGGECERAVAVDTRSARISWQRPLPSPARAATVRGHAVAVGNGVVAVSGGCEGVTRLDVRTGAVLGRTTGACPWSASDGTSIVSGDRGGIVVRSQADGAVTATWRREAARVGDVLSSTPLVVTAATSSGRRLLALERGAVTPFGPDAGGYGGEVAASYVDDHVLWVQYPDGDGIVGFDLGTFEQVAQVEAPDDARLAGILDGRLVLTADEAADGSAAILTFDPLRPAADPVAGGRIPPSAPEDGPVRRTTVAAGQLLVIRDGRLEALPLASAGPS